MSEVSERLARFEASLAHICKAVDRAERCRNDTAGRLARVEQQVAHIERMIPAIERNVAHGAHDDGWREAKEDAQKDTRGVLAIIISLLALAASAGSAVWGGR